MAPGDAIIGVRSSGIHSNGLTLARKALFEAGGLAVDQYLPELGCSVGEELLRPTDIYVRPVMELLKARRVPVRALVNITGDGLLNLARIKAPASFQLDELPEPQPIFRLIQERGRIPDAEMYRVFNMGIGFCLIVPDDTAALHAVEDDVRGPRLRDAPHRNRRLRRMASASSCPSRTSSARATRSGSNSWHPAGAAPRARRARHRH